MQRLVESVKRLTGGGSDCGTPRASMSESGAISFEAMVGAVFAEGDGAGAVEIPREIRVRSVGTIWLKC